MIPFPLTKIPLTVFCNSNTNAPFMRRKPHASYHASLVTLHKSTCVKSCLPPPPAIYSFIRIRAGRFMNYFSWNCWKHELSVLDRNKLMSVQSGSIKKNHFCILFSFDNYGYWLFAPPSFRSFRLFVLKLDQMSRLTFTWPWPVDEIVQLCTPNTMT